jgi:hypothetical protein
LEENIVKYIWHWEWKMDDMEQENLIGARFQEELEKTPEKFPKMLTKTCFTGRCKGFRFIEADTEEQLKNLVAIWWPTEDWKLEPFLDNDEVMQKAFQEYVQE